MITSLGWSNRLAVEAGDVFSCTISSYACVSTPTGSCCHTVSSGSCARYHHNCGLHWHHCGVSKEPAGLPFPMQSQLCPGLSPGGWLGSQTRHSLRSLSLQQRCLSSCQPVTDCVFRSPWSARIPALPRESGEVSQPGCRCYVPKRFVATAASVVLALRLGSSFALNSIPNFWLAYIRFVFGQYPKVRFFRFFFIQAHLVQNWDVLKGGMPSEQVDGVPSVSCAD